MTSQTPKPIIALDIDDVLANVIDSVRLWANEKTGVELAPEHYRTDDEYWHYFDSIWQRHGVADKVAFADVLKHMETDQSNIATVEGAREAIRSLGSKYDFVFITSRPPFQKDATRRWLDEHIDPTIPLYLSFHPGVNDTSRSKGEICAELGVSLLIDDNTGNCQSAIDYGVDAIVFGDYGWNEKVPNHMKRYVTWREVGEYLLNEAQY